MNKGTINWFNADKGYGFIMADDMQDVFAYLISIQGMILKNTMKVKRLLLISK